MKKLRSLILVLAMATALMVSGCSEDKSTDTIQESQQEVVEQPEEETQEPESNQQESDQPEDEEQPTIEENGISLNDIPEYSGTPYVAINNNVPFFTEADYTTDAFETYSDLDSLGRCGVAYANICVEIMPTEERGSIGSVKPTGWHTIKYDCVDGKYLYNRCHLIGFQLAGENANEKNLITGTRYLNVDGMLPFENLVADYVKETQNHVLYRVTPIFEGENLVASGVLMEAYSVEDNGEGITFCTYCYNVQPGIVIDYATGDSVEDGTVPENTEKVEETATEQPAEEVSEPDSITAEVATPTSEQYVLNTNTKKFHRPSCSSIKQMKDSNKQEVTATREDIISMGYDPCKKCNP